MNLAAIVSEFLDTLMTLPQHSYDRGLLFPFVLSLLLITQESEAFLSLDTALCFPCRVMVGFSRVTHGEALEEIPGSLL